jgi:hypothetical protein
VSVIQADLTTPRPFTEFTLSAANVFKVKYRKLLLGQSFVKEWLIKGVRFTKLEQNLIETEDRHRS